MLSGPTPGRLTAPDLAGRNLICWGFLTWSTFAVGVPFTNAVRSITIPMTSLLFMSYPTDTGLAMTGPAYGGGRFFVPKVKSSGPPAACEAKNMVLLDTG